MAQISGQGADDAGNQPDSPTPRCAQNASTIIGGKPNLLVGCGRKRMFRGPA
jgi:hypothetical protein